MPENLEEPKPVNKEALIAELAENWEQLKVPERRKMLEMILDAYRAKGGGGEKQFWRDMEIALKRGREFIRHILNTKPEEEMVGPNAPLRKVQTITPFNNSFTKQQLMNDLGRNWDVLSPMERAMKLLHLKNTRDESVDEALFFKGLSEKVGQTVGDIKAALKFPIDGRSRVRWKNLTLRTDVPREPRKRKYTGNGDNGARATRHPEGNNMPKPGDVCEIDKTTDPHKKSEALWGFKLKVVDHHLYALRRFKIKLYECLVLNSDTGQYSIVLQKTLRVVG